MARQAAITISATSHLLRLLRAAPEPKAATPTVLGVDDFALRRGHVYGTLLVDMNARGPVDLLADRRAETLRDWLVTHPRVEIVCRDRGSAYADDAREEGPTQFRWPIAGTCGTTSATRSNGRSPATTLASVNPWPKPISP